MKWCCCGAGTRCWALPITAPIDHLRETVWRRVAMLLPELAQLPADQAQPALRALASLRGIIDLARSADTPFDTEHFDAALERLRAADLVPPVAGAVLAFALLDGRADSAALAQRLRGELGGAYVDPADRLGFLGGIIAVAPELLWTLPEIVAELDAVVGDADEDAFIALLPHLRLALMPLDPRDVDRLAEMVAGRLGISGLALQQVSAISEGEVLANLALDRAMADLLALEGVA